MGSTKLYHWEYTKPLVDGTIDLFESATVDESISESDSEKETQINKNISQNMGKLLNCLFQHISQSKDEIIPCEDFGGSLIDAGLLGISFTERLKKKERAGLNSEVTKTMQLVLGLGKQELYTHPATWAIPKEFLTVGGTDELIVSEYRSNADKELKPLQYNREITIIMNKDEGLDYLISQPITFRDRKNHAILGTCRVLTTFIFGKDMSLHSQKQEVKAASILK